MIIKHHGREYLRNAVSDIIKAELKNHKVSQHEGVLYVLCHQCEFLPSYKEYIKHHKVYKHAIIHLSNFTIVRNVMQLLKVSWV